MFGYMFLISEYDKPLECQTKYFNFGNGTTHMKTTIHIHLGHIRHFTSNMYFQDRPTHFFSTFAFSCVFLTNSKKHKTCLLVGMNNNNYIIIII